MSQGYNLVMSVLRDYVEAALKLARCEKIADGEYFCSIDALKGPYGSGSSQEAAVADLKDALEEWLVASLRDDDELPEVAGISLNFGGKRWQDPSPAATSSQSSAR